MNGPTFAQPVPAPAPAPKAPPHRTSTQARAPRPDPDAGGGLRVLTYLRLHWLMIAFCGTLLGAAGAYAAWELLPSKYESYALLQVSSVPASLANQNNPNQARTDFTTYVKTQARLLKSDFVLNAALRDIKDLPTIKDQKEPIKFLDEEVLVSWQDGSEVVQVTFKGHNPSDVKKVVDSVDKAFLAEVVQKEVEQKRALLTSIESARDAMQTMLMARSKKPDATKPGAIIPAGGPLPAAGADPMAPNAPGPFPVAQNPAGGLAPPVQPPMTDLERLLKYDPKALVTRFGHLHGNIEQLPLEIQLAREQMKEIEGKVNALKTAPLSQTSLTDADKDHDVLAQSIAMKKAKARYETYRASGDENAPGVIDLRKAWEAQEARLQALRLEKARGIEEARRLDEMRRLAAAWEAQKDRVKHLEGQLAVAKDSMARLGKQLDTLPPPGDKVLQAGFLNPEKPYLTENTDMVILDGIYARLVAQHQLVKLELDSPPRVKLIQPASNPTQKDIKKQVLGTVFAGLMGYALLALGVIAYETLGKRVSSLGDLKSAGPAPVVGVIPHSPAEATGRDPLKRAAANEAIDKLRAYVAQTWLSRGVTSVAVTSPLGDEGKAFTAFGLASSLAQAGYKTLAIDFDLREPALHAHAGVPNQTGLCEVLRGEADARACVQSLPSGLDLLPAGKWSDEARKAAVGGRLEALLTRLKEPYDCVVLHGHALLTVAESVEVARRCEVVLVCARYRETTMPLLRKATDRVAAMEIPYSGVVYVGATEQEALC
jgi:Mrp family chromosome partitioning ATPase